MGPELGPTAVHGFLHFPAAMLGPFRQRRAIPVHNPPDFFAGLQDDIEGDPGRHQRLHGLAWDEFIDFFVRACRQIDGPCCLRMRLARRGLHQRGHGPGGQVLGGGRDGWLGRFFGLTPQEEAGEEEEKHHHCPPLVYRYPNSQSSQ